MGSATPQSRDALAFSRAAVLPSGLRDPSALWIRYFGAHQLQGPTLQVQARGCPHMARCQCGSLLLSLYACATFHALQLSLRRAFQNGFLLSANYMWSHSINDGSIGGGESDTPQDSFCRSCDKASSDDDVRQIFNLSAVCQLPFGAGRRYFSSPGLVRTLLGGWTLSAIGTAQSGLPVNITIDRSNGSVPGGYAISGEERPNYVPGVSLTPPGGSTPDEWINPAAFSVPAIGTFGDLGRNAFRAPRITQLDLGLSKDVPLSDHMNVRFRADGFNVFNRAQYGAPNADGSQTNFGIITTPISNYATGRGTPREFQLSAKISF
jgi:hypothetical protein